ncbi:BRI1 kinase inhibitor 1-like [Cornus florida]|uniref:BRI1 kinase inhibitor 1-like n=1 Tax=Cornus florida TaxID=4283 RepID=UPI002899DFAD|nr:BRI1 kinase inhibitor 1-like [Cornus florida]
MDTQHHPKMRDKVEANQQPPPPPPTTTSPSSSPSHEFSFTISLQTINPNKPKAAQTSSIAIDLSPADDIFFHGHLLPLHLLSHLPESPRSSTNSLDSFTLPITELLEEPSNKTTTTNNTTDSSTTTNQKNYLDHHHHQENINGHESTTKARTKSKSKSFWFFSLSKRRKGGESREGEDKEKQKRKLRLEVMSHVVKRYARMIRPFLSFRGRRESRQLCRQSYSFSANLSFRSSSKEDAGRGKRREYLSAPASMRTSPTNSGLLVASGAIATSTSDSTMEELQAAIQAAIAHCKNSIAVEEKINCKD